MIHVEPIPGQSGIFVERREGEALGPATRCFRFDKQGNADWAPYGELTQQNPHPRWYGFALKAQQFTIGTASNKGTET